MEAHPALRLRGAAASHGAIDPKPGGLGQLGGGAQGRAVRKDGVQVVGFELAVPLIAAAPALARGPGAERGEGHAVAEGELWARAGARGVLGLDGGPGLGGAEVMCV